MDEMNNSTDSFFVSTVEEGCDADGGGWGYDNPRVMQIKNLWSFIIAVIFVGLIIVSNGVSLFAFAYERRLRTYNNYYIINLSLADLLTGFVLIIDVIYTTVGFYPFPAAACYVTTCLKNALVSISNITVVVICIDRHQAVYDPIEHFLSRNKRQAMIRIAACWTVSIVFWSCFDIVWGFVSVVPHNPLLCLPTYSYYPAAALVANAIKFIFPLVIVIILYTRIYFQIKKAVGGKLVKATFGRDASSEGKQTLVLDENDLEEPKLEENKKRDLPKRDVNVEKSSVQGTEKCHQCESSSEMRKATRTLTFIIVSFIVAWLPINVFETAHSIDPALINFRLLPLPLFVFLSYLGFGNGFLNPVAYLASQPLFRQTVGRLICGPFNNCRRMRAPNCYC